MTASTDFVGKWMKLMARADVDALVDLFAEDGEVVRFPGVARGQDQIRAYLIGFLSAHGKYELVSVDQEQSGSDSVIWEATVSTKSGPLQAYGVFIFDENGKVRRHFPGIQGYWGSP